MRGETIERWGSSGFRILEVYVRASLVVQLMWTFTVVKIHQNRQVKGAISRCDHRDGHPGPHPAPPNRGDLPLQSNDRLRIIHVDLDLLGRMESTGPDGDGRRNFRRRPARAENTRPRTGERCNQDSLVDNDERLKGKLSEPVSFSNHQEAHMGDFGRRRPAGVVQAPCCLSMHAARPARNARRNV